MADVGRIEHHMDVENAQRRATVARLATRQHGVVGRWQLVELSIGRGWIQHGLDVGLLHRVHAGVYAVGHRRISPRGRATAAVLACGRGALLSHRSAAWLWDILPDNRSIFDVTVPGRSRRHRAGLAVHRTLRLDREDRAVHEGIPVTSVARTLLDLAEVAGPQQLERALDAAERLRRFDLSATQDLIRRSPGRRGLRHLSALLGTTWAEPARTRSDLERRFLDLCREAGLPLPQVNTQVAGYEVDMAWPDQRLVVELDSYRYHRARKPFEDDRVRDATLQLAGERVMRVTDRRLEGDWDAVEDLLRSLLAVRSTRLHVRPRQPRA